MIDRQVETCPILCHKSTITEKKYLLEGDQEIAKRSENMLTIDRHLELEFDKTLELFEVFVCQPAVIERDIVQRMKRVMKQLTASTNDNSDKDSDLDDILSESQDATQNDPTSKN